MHTSRGHLSGRVVVEASHRRHTKQSGDGAVFHVVRIRFFAVGSTGVVEHAGRPGPKSRHRPAAAQILFVQAAAKLIDGNGVGSSVGDVSKANAQIRATDSFAVTNTVLAGRHIHAVTSARPSATCVDTRSSIAVDIRWTFVDRKILRPPIVLIRRDIEFPFVVQGRLFDVWQQKYKPIRSFVRISDSRCVPASLNEERRKPAVNIVVVVQRDANLLQVAFALSPPRGFASLLHCGKQQRDQNCDDRDYNQQFDQCECSSSLLHGMISKDSEEGIKQTCVSSSPEGISVCVNAQTPVKIKSSGCCASRSRLSHTAGSMVKFSRR